MGVGLGGIPRGDIVCARDVLNPFSKLEFVQVMEPEPKAAVAKIRHLDLPHGQPPLHHRLYPRNPGADGLW